MPSSAMWKELDKGKLLITVLIHCNIHTLLNTINMIHIFNVNKGNWGRVCLSIPLFR